MRREFRFDDGGRAASGYRGKAGDCVVRAIAIAAERPYQEIYELVNRAALRERTGKRKRGISNARTGVYKVSIHRVMRELGWEWTPTMQIGSGCTVHLRPDELPAGRLVVSVSKHLTAVIDGVIHDTHDCSRRGRRCVYGYWSEGRGARARKRVEAGRESRAMRRVVLREDTSGAEEAMRRRRREEEKKPRKKGFWEWLFG
ncbi:MAG TPA: hypothetical protein VJN93_18045 [Candidatus Acidoferrum sp.]|nr:hypothetical protein [Candidatus Acidoferrum sp.]